MVRFDLSGFGMQESVLSFEVEEMFLHSLQGTDVCTPNLVNSLRTHCTLYLASY